MRRLLRTVVRAVTVAAALAACNYPGGPDAPPLQPLESPTSPPLATLTTPQPSECVERLTVIAESGYLDATPAEPGQRIERVWRVRNAGTCTWTSDYELAPVEGLSFGLGPLPLSGVIAPGEETDLRLQVVAPAAAGFYAGGWALRSPDGALLGAGSRPLRLRVNVSAPVPLPLRVVYDFWTYACEARWAAASPTRQGRLLPCPGYDRDPGGSLRLVETPRFANGYTEDEPGLVLHPPAEEGGLISGTFPPYAVEPGDQFRLLLGCSAGSPGCQARCQLNMREGDALSPIAEWLLDDESGVLNLAVDLSFLAGRSVAFVLAVDADGPGDADAVIWMPAVMR